MCDFEKLKLNFYRYLKIPTAILDSVWFCSMVACTYFYECCQIYNLNYIYSNTLR